VDHTEHDVQVLITEQGAADLRGTDAYERAKVIIENCAHPISGPRCAPTLTARSAQCRDRHGLPPLFRPPANGRQCSRAEKHPADLR
jgi:succinyl-CoA:acetate CoA-transferase